MCDVMTLLGDPGGGALFGSGGLGGPSAQDQAYQTAQQAEAQRQANITKGMDSINKAFAGYDQNFYNNRAQAFLNYALPQLGQQYQNTRNTLGFNLANRGLSNSSQANKTWSDLYNQLGQAKQSIADQAQQQSNALQTQVSNLKQGVIGQLYQSADPSQATLNTASAISQINQPSAFAQLPNEFNNLLQNYYSSQLLNAYRTPAYTPYGNQSQAFNFAMSPVSSTIGGP